MYLQDGRHAKTVPWKVFATVATTLVATLIFHIDAGTFKSAIKTLKFFKDEFTIFM